MVSRQILAQLGVFALLGLNVGAYFVFWPHRESENKSEAKAPAPTKLLTQLPPEKKPASLPPAELPSTVVEDARPLEITNPPSSPSIPSVPSEPAVPSVPKGEDDSISRLLQHIQKETGTPAPMKAAGEEASPPRAAGPLDKPGPAPMPVEKPRPTDDGVAVTSAITPKVAPSPWLLNMEMIGHQTQLTARLKKPDLEIKILCDRIELKAPGGLLQAVGKVTVSGPSLKATCQRLKLPLHETRLIFEEKVRIEHDSKLGSVWHAEQITWDLPLDQVEMKSNVTPAEFRPSGAFPAFPPIVAPMK